MRKLVASSVMAISMMISANSAGAADFEAEQAIRGLVVGGEVDFGVADMTVVERGVRYDTMIAGLPILGDSNVFVGYRGARFDKSGTNGDDDA